MEINKKEVGHKISDIRKSHNLTMEDFGKIVDAPKSAVNNWEKGRNLPSKPRLLKIAMFGDTNTQYLLYGSNEEQTYKYLLNLLINFTSSNSLLSGKLSSYLDYYQENSKFRKYSEKDISLPVYWDEHDDKDHIQKMGEKRVAALKDIAKRVNNKMDSDKIKTYSETVINKYLEFVFNDISSEDDLTNYGMLKMVSKDLFWLKMNLRNYEEDNIDYNLRASIEEMIDKDSKKIEENIKKIDKTIPNDPPKNKKPFFNDDLPF